MPGISRSLLVQRLRHLERKGIVEAWPLPNGRGKEYRLTPAGKDLEPVLIALGRWSVQWLYERVDHNDVNAETLMWWMHRRVDAGHLPSQRRVVLFEPTAPKRSYLWMLAERGEVSFCLSYPGFELDAIVRCPTPALARVFSGQLTWDDAIGSSAIELSGVATVLRALPRWFLWSPWAPDVRAEVTGRDELGDP
jgi:DNA-binding MarR family transcriptional regulator